MSSSLFQEISPSHVSRESHKPEECEGKPEVYDSTSSLNHCAVTAKGKTEIKTFGKI